MQGIFLLLIWAALVGLGMRAPFVFGLGYIWVDLFTPQMVNPEILGLFPVSLIMALGAVGGYLLADRRHPPGPRLGIVLALVWAMWITLTTTWAVMPDSAWEKWDWASKTVLFSAFMPFLFRSRAQIEAAVLAIVLSIGAYAIPFGAKTLVAGGGYGQALGLLRVNFALGESSTLAVDCVAILPLLAWLARHSQIMPRIVPQFVGRLRLLSAAYLGLAAAAVLTTLGTYARAGLVSLGIFAVFHWWASKHKILLAAGFCAAGIGLFTLMGDRYSGRMSTIADPTHEASASTRLAVWAWTYNYALANPLGGGFDVYRINHLDYEVGDQEVTEQARAFHSMYFEVLGEQGFVGAGIFAGMIATFFVGAWRVTRRARQLPELAWAGDLAKAMTVSALAYFAGTAFIGVAFQPFHYYLFALTVALLNHSARALAGATAPPQPLGASAQPARA